MLEENGPGSESLAHELEARLPDASLVPPLAEPLPAPTPQSVSAHPWRRLVAAITVVVIAAVGGGVGIGWNLARAVHTSPAAQSPIAAVPQSGSSQDASQSGGSLNAQAIASKVEPAIVDINTVIQSAGGPGQGAATGIILTSSGEVLTNHHVVAGATSITVTIAGRSGTYAASVIGVDLAADVALIQVHGVSGLRTATLADSSTLQVGERVVAIGNALGRGGSPSVTQGTITALDQSITATEDGGATEQLTGMIESDAQIVPGDSGGALVNSAGQVIGLLTAGQARGFRYSSTTIGYAVPSNTALSVVNQIRSGQASSEIILGQVGYIGVQVRDLDAQSASQLGVSAGALVVGVLDGSPAAQAGVTPSSVITAVAGTAISSAAALGTALHTHKPGDQVRLTWVDSAGTHAATVTLVSGPAV